MGIRKSHIYFLAFFMLAAGTAIGQGNSNENKKDPFRNDPFFSRPLSELLELPADKDTSDTLHENRKFNRYVLRMNDNGIDLDGALESGPYNSSALYGTYPSLPMIHFNRVDALFLGLRRERMQWYNNDGLLGIPGINPHGMIGYSFGQKEWQYVLGLEKYLGRNNHVLIGGEFHSATTTDDYWRVGLTETSLTSFLGGYDFMDYYKQHGWGAYLLIRTDRYFEGGVAFADDRFFSQSTETSFALFGAGNRYRMNPPVDVINNAFLDEIDISSLNFSAAFNPKRLLISRYFTFSLNGQVELGDPGITDSEYNYSKYLGELVYFLNFEKGGVFKHRIRIGSIHGDAPLMKTFQLGGVGTMRALPYKSMPDGFIGGNQMVLSNAEIQFGDPGFGSNEWIDFDDFYINFFLDSGWTEYNTDLVDRENDNPFDVFSSFSLSDLRHNGGIGIGSSLIRAELAWDLNNTARKPVLWIRLNPTF